MFHGILADDLKRILVNGNGRPKRPLSTYTAAISKDKEDGSALFEIIYPEKYLSDLVGKTGGWFLCLVRFLALF
ncbi:MAG: hypothetical protein AAGU74_15250 [Bacillota bacterium]